jgi:hypothetical protein
MVGFSSLALANLVRYYNWGKIKYLATASLFVGLGVLTRVETIILFVTLTAFGILIGKGKQAIKKILSYAIFPMLAVIGVYFALSLIIMGRIDLGLAGKSYDSFEMNQSILTGGDISLARQETRRLFGTQEENQGSIFRAIMRNPPAFALRIFANAKTIPVNYLSFFGKKLGPIVLLFAIYGLYALIRKKAWMPLALLLIWPVHALVALGFLSLHIIPQTIYLPLLLGVIGIVEAFSNKACRFDILIFLLCTFILFIFSWILNKPAFLTSFLLLGSVFIIHLLVNLNVKLRTQGVNISVVLLLAVGLILREPFQFPKYPALGKSASEMAVHYMEAELPEQTAVLVPNPLPAIAARMIYLMMDNIPESTTTMNDLVNYLQEKNVKGVYLDSHRRGRNDIYDLMEQGTQPYFFLGYTSQDKTVRVYLIR